MKGFPRSFLEEIVPRPMIRVAPAEAKPVTPRRSGKVVRQLDRYGVFDSEALTYSAVIIDSDDDPVSDLRVMASSGVNLWLDAMDTEIHSMYDRSVWALIAPPEGIKPIGLSWIY